ncbi:MAG: hypothetical protein KA451_12990 [Methyloversatilis sp.]|jgi:sporulation protein YlmC with PRC-barrel domain|nr:hypothetical protein [Methyloversatilis sp.]MBP6195302.1 hypothetical protein [Methyloversatilis sp.]
MTTRMLMSALAGAVAVVTVALLGTLFISHRIGSDGATADLARSSLDGREVFDAEGLTLGVVERTVAVQRRNGAIRYAMVRSPRTGDAGLRLAVPTHRLKAVEDGLMLKPESRRDEIDDHENDGDFDSEAAAGGDFLPTVAQQRSRT